VQFTRFEKCVNQPVDRRGQRATSDEDPKFHVSLEGGLGQAGAGQEAEEAGLERAA
jgi:hypothetical protein